MRILKKIKRRTRLVWHKKISPGSGFGGSSGSWDISLLPNLEEWNTKHATFPNRVLCSPLARRSASVSFLMWDLFLKQCFARERMDQQQKRQVLVVVSSNALTASEILLRQSRSELFGQISSSAQEGKSEGTEPFSTIVKFSNSIRPIATPIFLSPTLATASQISPPL